MKTFTVTDFESLHAVLKPYRADKRWVFRGHASPEWDLLPKAGRPPYSNVNDKSVFESWKRRAVEYVSYQPSSDWEWLSIAQHHRLATRLLDWTMNPLNATFFAVRDEIDSDSIVYAASFKYGASPEKYHPMEQPGVVVFRPSGVVPRITRQGGVFSLHDNPRTPLDISSDALHDLHRIVIQKSHRSSMLAELSYYGINSATLFPDLDGLSDFVNWTISSKEYWNILA
jgi:FRG domain-containing protein